MPDIVIKVAHIAGLVSCSTFGALAFKRYVDQSQIQDLYAGLAAYLISNWFWITVLRSEGLGYSAVVPPLLTTMILTLASTVLFGERLGPMRIAGLGFAALSIVLFSIPQSET